jgi:hypothetical protein
MRILFADLAKARRDLIDSKALDDGPFFNRLWYHHLFWICSFIKSSTGIYAKRLIRITTELYCKSVDRIFDSTRYDEYLERQQKECEQLQEKVRELKKEQQERAERRFERETTYQALTNPHFVATPHTHQDR